MHRKQQRWRSNRWISFEHDKEPGEITDEQIVNSLYAIAALAEHLGVDAGELAERCANGALITLYDEFNKIDSECGTQHTADVLALVRGKEG